jgi:ApaG protein
MKKNEFVIVRAEAKYIPEQSDPPTQKFIWSYEMIIDNQSPVIVQLLNRYWRIIDLSGKIEEVQGAGVIGLQPIIKPNKSFIYTSFCQLTMPQGTMEGYYEMQNVEDEEHFIVEIPKFILSAPSVVINPFRAKLH